MDEVDEAERLNTLANETFNKYIEISNSKTQSSIIQNFNLKANNTTNICAHCGKSVKGHFEDKTFKMGCDCEEALLEKERLQKIESLNDEITKLQKQRDSLVELNKKEVYKHAVSFIKKIQKENNEVIDKALDTFICNN